jgi:hypothetical protein
MATRDVSLFRAGILENLIQELKRYKINITAVGEIQWKGNDIFNNDGYTVCYSGSNDRDIFVTGLLAHNKLKGAIIDFIPADEWICYIKLRGRFFNMTLICTHAPTKERNETKKNSFHDKLDHVYQKASKHYIKTVMGDMNAKVAKDVRIHNVGRYSFREESWLPAV